ncbi:MAG: response regulator [Planctomycetota bacterium]
MSAHRTAGGTRDFNRDGVLDTLRLTPRQAEALLDSLQQETAGADQQANRSEARHFYTDLTGIPLEVSHPGGTTSSFSVIPVDLSAKGIGLLHGGFVYQGTEVIATLTDLSGLERRVAGRVMDCRLYRGRVHVLGVRFEEPIELDAYMTDLDAEPEVARPTVLHIDDSADFRRLFAYFVGQSGASVEGLASVDASVATTAEDKFAAVFVDAHIGGQQGTDFIKQLADAGYSKPVLLVTGDESPELREAALAAGASEVLTKPLSGRTVADAIATHVAGLESAGEAIVSEMWADQKMRQLIRTHCEGLPARLETLAGSRGDREAWQTHCRDMRIDAANYGFPDLADAMQGLEQTETPADESTNEALAAVKKLMLRMRVGLSRG